MENSGEKCMEEIVPELITGNYFYHGTCLCLNGAHPDVVWKNPRNADLVAIEIKDKKKHIISGVGDKVINTKNYSQKQNLNFSVFILQFSSRNAVGNILAGSCRDGLLQKGIKINPATNIIEDSDTKFIIVSCKDFNEDFFEALL